MNFNGTIVRVSPRLSRLKATEEKPSLRKRIPYDHSLGIVRRLQEKGLWVKIRARTRKRLT